MYQDKKQYSTDKILVSKTVKGIDLTKSATDIPLVTKLNYTTKKTDNSY